MEKTLVIGSGVSSLIFLYYNRTAFAITGSKIGGMFSSQKSLGPQLLWVDKNTTDLLENLDLPLDKRVVKIGYHTETGVHLARDLQNATIANLRNQYAYKTRGTKDHEAYMSQGVKEFEAFVIGVNDVVHRLVERVAMRLINGNATGIALYSKVIEFETVDNKIALDFDELVSTVPAPLFLKLIGREDLSSKLLGLDKAYAVAKVQDLPEEFKQPFFDYIYVPHSKYPFHRVKHDGTGSAVVEYSLKPEDPKPAKAAIHPKGQIIGGHEVLESLPPYVTLLGRYAEWKPGIKTNQVLERILGTKGN